jgi:quercetin dioxygenase-like cupin family protein
MHAPTRARRRVAALAAGAALIAVGVALPLVGQAAPASKVSADVLAVGPLPSGKAYKTTQSDVEIDRLTIKPGGESGWHAHDGPILLIVKAGTLTNYLARGRGCTRSRVTAGHTMLESAGHPHMARNEGTRNVVVYAVNNFAKGGTGAIEATRPPGCAH